MRKRVLLVKENITSPFQRIHSLTCDYNKPNFSNIYHNVTGAESTIHHHFKSIN